MVTIEVGVCLHQSQAAKRTGPRSPLATTSGETARHRAHGGHLRCLEPRARVTPATVSDHLRAYSPNVGIARRRGQWAWEDPRRAGAYLLHGLRVILDKKEAFMADNAGGIGSIHRASVIVRNLNRTMRPYTHKLVSRLLIVALLAALLVGTMSVEAFAVKPGDDEPANPNRGHYTCTYAIPDPDPTDGVFYGPVGGNGLNKKDRDAFLAEYPDGTCAPQG